MAQQRVPTLNPPSWPCCTSIQDGRDLVFVWKICKITTKTRKGRQQSSPSAKCTITRGTRLSWRRILVRQNSRPTTETKNKSVERVARAIPTIKQVCMYVVMWGIRSARGCKESNPAWIRLDTSLCRGPKKSRLSLGISPEMLRGNCVQEIFRLLPMQTCWIPIEQLMGMASSRDCTAAGVSSELRALCTPLAIPGAAVITEVTIPWTRLAIWGTCVAILLPRLATSLSTFPRTFRWWSDLESSSMVCSRLVVLNCEASY